MVLSVSWPQALAWRMERQLIEPVGTLAAPDVVRRLCAVQAQVASSADLAIRVRQGVRNAGEVSAALAEGRLIKTWAMRGTLHYLTPEEGGQFLALLAAGRTWERPSWQRYFGVSPAQVAALRDVVHDALDGRILTRDELVAAVAADPAVGHVAESLRSGWGTLLKPLAWQGVLCFGPSQGNRVTFMRPDAASTDWAGVPSSDEAGPKAIAAYLGAYGPATLDSFHNWLSRGWAGKRQLTAWFAALRDRLVEVDVEGERAWVLAEHADALASTAPNSTVRLLPGFDEWVLGTGTDDPHVLPPARRSAVSKQAGWIAPVVIVGGVVHGTWSLREDRVSVEWFSVSGAVPRGALGNEVARLATITARPLGLDVSTA